MTIHRKLSPSKRPRWAVCARSIWEEAKYPDTRSGAAAIDGTHTHTFLNKCLTEQKNAAEYIGQTLKDDDGEFVVDAERAERVQFALDYISKRQIEMGFPEWYSEVFVDPASIFGRDDLGGTVDVLLIGKDEIEIIDLKDGMNPVSADSLQLDQYGFGVIAKLNGNVPQTSIRFTIIQPKLRVKGQSGIATMSKSMSDFLVGEDVLLTQAKATDDPDAPLVPGDHCTYCKHGGACAARSNAAMQASGIIFANLDVAQQAADKEPTSMTDEQIREVLEAAPLIRQLIEDVEKEALRRFESGKPISGLKAVRGRGSRGWSLSEDEIAEKLKKMGMPRDTIWHTSLISVAQAEKAKWTKRDGSEEQLSPRQLKTLQTEYVKKSDGKLIVVAESDERPAVSLTAEHLFDAVPVAPAVEVLPSWLS
jgi:hypothetical protein